MRAKQDSSDKQRRNDIIYVGGETPRKQGVQREEAQYGVSCILVVDNKTQVHRERERHHRLCASYRAKTR